MQALVGDLRAFVLGGLLLAGCGTSGADESVTGLHFTTSSEFPDNPAPTNVDVTLTEPEPTRAIYGATLTLPNLPSGIEHCPADLGYRHTIVFTRDALAPVTATLNTGGCREATISGAPPARQTNDAYWSLLAQNLGVEAATLFETAAP